MSNTAKSILVPDSGSVLRVAFLYVGQGDSTLLVVPDGTMHKFVLIDSNLDKENGGINIPKLLDDLLEDELDIFMNTHPHKDHLGGISDIFDRVGIREVWHSGHKPGKDHGDPYQEMKKVIDTIGSENEYVFYGTNDENAIRKSDRETKVIKPIGDIEYLVLSPAEYVSDEIDNEESETRYRRIHEYCAVIKFSYGTVVKSVLIPGDADKTAWKEHINYHSEKLSSDVLSAVHHGSRTFFKDEEDDEDPYEDHITQVEPKYLVISAPTQQESPHDHPHNDALELYKKYIEEEGILHLGENRESVIVDIYPDGQIEVKIDTELVNYYGFGNDNGDDFDNSSKEGFFIGSGTATIDDKPMG